MIRVAGRGAVGGTLPSRMQFWRETADPFGVGSKGFAGPGRACKPDFVIGSASKLAITFCQYRYPSPTGRSEGTAFGPSCGGSVAGITENIINSISCGGAFRPVIPGLAVLPRRRPVGMRAGLRRPVRMTRPACRGAAGLSDTARRSVPGLQPGRSLTATTLLQFGEPPCSTRY